MATSKLQGMHVYGSLMEKLYETRQALQIVRRSIERLGPYQSLALLAVPVCLVEPLKLIAVFVVGKGHWITGTVMITLAYATSFLVVERLFVIVKPKLLKLRWFARLWSWFIVQRYKLARRFVAREKARSVLFCGINPTRLQRNKPVMRSPGTARAAPFER
jgi:hypothetical protein